MARSREFDPKDTVKTATLLFRRQGFLGTSIDDLVKETGVSRYGLYSIYKDKKGLFLAALDNFSNDYVTTLLANLEKESASLTDVYAYFSAVIDSAGTPEGKLSCLMCSSSNELSGVDIDIDARLSTHFKRLRNAFYKALTNEFKRRELKCAGSSDLECLADYLLGVAHGSASLNRSGASKKVVKSFINTAMSAFNQE